MNFNEVSTAGVAAQSRQQWRVVLPMAWALGLGALSGLVAGGVGGRIVMRLIALADPSADGTFTDAKAIVGDFTVDGTLTVLAFGAFAGVMAGPLYLGMRRWLPVPPAWNGTAFGFFTLLTAGFLFFDPSNADFQIFEPALLVVFLFSALFFVNGLLLSGLMDRLYPEPQYTYSPRMTRAATGALALVCALGALGFVGGTIGMIEDSGTCLRAVGDGAGCAVFTDP